jgi:hypothetical protein
VGEAGWERAALAIARRAAGWPADKSVFDVGLCHGAAGVGHLFNRLFQATGEDCFAEAARFWLERTLALRQPGRGIAGYLSWSPGADGALTWLAEPGLPHGGGGRRPGTAGRSHPHRAVLGPYAAGLRSAALIPDPTLRRTVWNRTP